MANQHRPDHLTYQLGPLHLAVAVADCFRPRHVTPLCSISSQVADTKQPRSPPQTQLPQLAQSLAIPKTQSPRLDVVHGLDVVHDGTPDHDAVDVADHL